MVHNIVERKQSVPDTSRTQTTQAIEKACKSGHASFRFPLKTATGGCRLYIRNLRRNVSCNHGGQGNVFPLSTSHSIAVVSLGPRDLNDTVFFSTGIKKKNGTWDCGRQNDNGANADTNYKMRRQRAH